MAFCGCDSGENRGRGEGRVGRFFFAEVNVGSFCEEFFFLQEEKNGSFWRVLTVFFLSLKMVGFKKI